MIDLRSDTVTKPTAAMRAAMAAAEVGDDVYCEDPTVNALEARAAEIFGREAALFLPTGSMGNTIAARMHTQPGQEVVCESRAHLLDWEMAMVAAFAGCVPRTVVGEGGVFRWADVEKAIAPKIYFKAQTALVWVENTHNMAGGIVTPVDVLEEIWAGAKAAGLKTHCDGARVFNAAAALGVDVKVLTHGFDTVMFCLSKGLGAPVGSMLVGSRAAMDRARELRKALGGGMRQAGILAAAGLIALEEMPSKLADDHANAKLLAQAVASCPGVKVDLDRVQTNIVIFEVGAGKSGELVQALKAAGVLASAIGPGAVRLVTHRDVSREDCQRAAQILTSELTKLAS
ncbi:threonine aldolase family protein [Granulicella cerasi]|uniref:Threonine aldolase family protein n=1 Tax=Granulicella cerasi TaxID=741063 RepID=A0ABW1Z4K4_9BACT|nr:GntG family PLP-dependent aldolase [Granulicella cerasi]